VSDADPPIVAAFDVDGTVTTRDCVVPFLRRIAGTGQLSVGMIARTHRLVPAAFGRDRDVVKAIAAEAGFAGRSVATVTSEGQDFARHVHAHWLRAEIVDQLQAHVADGNVVLLVSASFEVYLRPLAELLGVCGALGTRLEADGDRYTGRLDGANCRGGEKVRRLNEWLECHRGGRDGHRIVAYGDSAGDRELLASADEAHWVGRSA
jgi:phosphatidylglycerophosphatase C